MRCSQRTASLASARTSSGWKSHEVSAKPNITRRLAASSSKTIAEAWSPARNTERAQSRYAAASTAPLSCKGFSPSWPSQMRRPAGTVRLIGVSPYGIKKRARASLSISPVTETPISSRTKSKPSQRPSASRVPVAQVARMLPPCCRKRSRVRRSASDSATADGSTKTPLRRLDNSSGRFSSRTANDALASRSRQGLSIAS